MKEKPSNFLFHVLCIPARFQMRSESRDMGLSALGCYECPLTPVRKAVETYLVEWMHFIV